MACQPLLDVQDCMLVVVDVQSSFLSKLQGLGGETLVDRVSWLIGVAKWANVPIIVTAEDIRERGNIDSAIQKVLPRQTPVFDKMTFGLAADPLIMAAVKETERNTIVLVGLETDVCVAQSAIGLLEEGFRPVVVADAVSTSVAEHLLGLERMRSAGVLVMGIKSLFYEWIRTVARSKQFDADCKKALGSPKGISL